VHETKDNLELKTNGTSYNELRPFISYITCSSVFMLFSCLSIHIFDLGFASTLPMVADLFLLMPCL